MELLIPIVVGSLILSVIAGILGCFVTWKQLSYFSDSISHAAILAIALAIISNMNTYFVGALFAILYAFFITILQRRKYWQFDNLLGVFSQGFLAIGILLITASNNLQMDLNSLLFGDILALQMNDIYALLVIMVLLLFWLIKYQKSLLIIAIDEEIAVSSNININKLKLHFLLILSLFVTFAINLVGVLLISALLLIPPAIAKPFCKSPIEMILMSIVFAVAGSVIGIISSYNFDLATGPAITAFLFILFLFMLLIKLLKFIIINKKLRLL